MCGIAGYWSDYVADETTAVRMAERIAHRGPDASGVWCDKAAGLALAHRRLSIIDLSPAGRQPMLSPCGRYALIYNGEIYNHLDLRADLERAGGGFDWRGHSDTETLLAALRHWGVRGALERLNGMFAFAFWDKAERSLHLARDRMGEKPLYYGQCGRTLLFGSELKALTAHPCWNGRLDREALTLFLRHNYIPAPWSIYRGIRKLPPARRWLAALVRSAPGHALDRIQRILPRRWQVSSLPDRLPKLAGVLLHQSGQAFYRYLVSHAKDPAALVLGAHEPETILDRPGDLPRLAGLRERMMLLDMQTYLPDDILTKVDRASMAVSLEARVPLLDHRVVEFAWRVPTHLKYRGGQSKWLLRQVLYRHVPRELMERPKMGFGVPIEQWLRGPLRDWAEVLLNEKRLREDSILAPSPIRQMWQQHMSGQRHWHYHLWDVLMLQAWLDEHAVRCTN